MSNKVETNVIKPETSIFVNESMFRLIEIESEIGLDSGISSIESYLSSTSGYNKTETEKDECYLTAQNKFKDFRSILKDLKINFYVNRVQFNYLTDLILKKLEYNADSVFFAIELTDLMGNISGMKFANDEEVKPIKVNPTEITYVYHLISQHKVKGLTKDAYTFSKILRRIGEIAKIVSYYDNKAKELSGLIKDWAASTLNGNDPIPTEEKISEEL